MKYTIEIPMGIVSENKVRTEHWSKRHKRKSLWKMFVRKEMRHFRMKPADKNQKFKLSFIHVRPKRSFIKDYDNIVGGCKELIDSLREEGFIWDDLIELIGIPMHTQIPGDDKKTIIIREDVEEK